MEPHASPEPIEAKGRVQALDVLRGFALLGILVPNILWFAWPQSATDSAEALAEVAGSAWPEGLVIHDAANRIGFALTETLFLGKFMFLFATLFGAGVFFFDRKFHEPGEKVPLRRGAGLWYARMGWMLVIGLVHAFGLWFGDILVWYALGGLGFLWWVRRWRPSTLIFCAAASYLLGLGVMVAILIFSDYAIRHGHIPPEQVGGADVGIELAAYRDGSYIGMVWLRFRTLAAWYLLMPFTFFWQVSGLMMLGLALTKLGVYTGERSARFYTLMAAIGIPLGLATTLGGWWLVGQLDSPIQSMYWMTLAQLFGFPAALGYAGVLLFLVRSAVLAPVTFAFGAVGRMALSNYLLQTVLCTTLFYGYGLGYFARIDYPGIFGVIAGVWVINIAFSLLWLRFFRFGPAEWLWRSLTYRRLWPMLR